MIFYSKGILLSLFLGISAFTAEARGQEFNLEADLVHYYISLSEVTVYTSDKYELDAVKVTVNVPGKTVAQELEKKYGLAKGNLADFSDPHSRLYTSEDRDIFVRKTNDDAIQVTIMKQGTQDSHSI